MHLHSTPPPEIPSKKGGAKTPTGSRSASMAFLGEKSGTGNRKSKTSEWLSNFGGSTNSLDKSINSVASVGSSASNGAVELREEVRHILVKIKLKYSLFYPFSLQVSDMAWLFTVLVSRFFLCWLDSRMESIAFELHFRWLLTRKARIPFAVFSAPLIFQFINLKQPQWF